MELGCIAIEPLDLAREQVRGGSVLLSVLSSRHSRGGVVWDEYGRVAA